MSIALRRFVDQMSRVDDIVHSTTLSGKSLQGRQIFYHIAIAARVAAWDAYLNSISLEAIERVGDPLNPEIIALKSLARAHSTRVSDKFNTPNFDKSREYLIVCTGFDPISVWSWPKKSMTWQSVQQRLNEVLKIRHSFAHGFSLPNYPWLPSRQGKHYLNKSVVIEVDGLISHLAHQTDLALDLHLHATYRTLVPSTW